MTLMRLEIEAWKRRDPIPTFADRLFAAGAIEPSEIDEMWDDARDEVEAAVRAADAGPLEPVESLTRHVLAPSQIGQGSPS